MVYLISGTSGNWTQGTTWKLADATSLLDSEAGALTLTTAFQLSAAFTPGAITVDAIAIKLRSVAGATGTITVALDTGGSTVTGTSVTLNISRLPLCTNAANEGGWYVFAFAASVTLITATTYKVKALVSSGASSVGLYCSATAADLARMLRTTTTQAPASGDSAIITGQDTGSSFTSYTVTIDNTATTQFGGVAVCIGGTLASGTTASTDYYLKMTGGTYLPGMVVYSGGTVTGGTLATPIPSTSSCVFEFVCGSDGQYGLAARNLSTVTLYGNAITTIITVLTANVAATDVILPVKDTTGWRAGDQVVIAPTGRTYTEGEIRTILTVDSSTQVTLTAGLTYAHLGVALSASQPTIAEVLYISRNVKVRSSTSSFASYVYSRATAATTLGYAEMYNIGATGTGQKGLEIETTTGSFSMTGCSIHDTRNYGLYVSTASGSISISSTVFYNLNSVAGANAGITISATSGAHTLTDLAGVLLQASSAVISLLDAGSTYAGWLFSGLSNSAGAPVTISEAASTSVFTLSSFNLHSATTSILNFPLANGRSLFTACVFWNSGAAGISCTTAQESLIFDNCLFFGQTSGGFTANAGSALLLLRNCTFNSSPSFTSTAGISLTGIAEVQLLNCVFGNATGHTTADLSFAVNVSSIVNSWNSLFSSTTMINGLAAAGYGAIVKSHRHNQTAGTFRSYMRNGTIFSETSIVNTTGGYSWKMTPTGGSGFPLISEGPTMYDTYKLAVNASVTVTVSVMVYYDGTYNGKMPRLVLVGGVISGIGSPGTDIIATAPSGFPSQWIQLSSTVTPTELGVIECYVDCDGSAGNVYIDDMGLV